MYIYMRRRCREASISRRCFGVDQLIRIDRIPVIRPMSDVEFPAAGTYELPANPPHTPGAMPTSTRA